MCILLINRECWQVIELILFLPAARSPSVVVVLTSFGQQERLRLEEMFEGR